MTEDISEISLDKELGKEFGDKFRRKVKEIANGCWWVEIYLMDRCGLTTSWKSVQDRKRERF